MPSCSGWAPEQLWVPFVLISQPRPSSRRPLTLGPAVPAPLSSRLRLSALCCPMALSAAAPSSSFPPHPHIQDAAAALRGTAHPISGAAPRIGSGSQPPGSPYGLPIHNSAAAARCGGRAGAAGRPRRNAPWRTAWGRSRGSPSRPPPRAPRPHGRPAPALAWCSAPSWPTAAPRGASRASPTSRSSTGRSPRCSASPPPR